MGEELSQVEYREIFPGASSRRPRLGERWGCPPRSLLWKVGLFRRSPKTEQTWAGPSRHFAQAYWLGAALD